MRRTGKEREEIGDMGVLLDALKKSAVEIDRDRTTSFGESFEKQRRDFGKGYQVQNELVSVSKQGIKALKSGDATEVERCKQKMFRLWDDIGNINVPLDTWWQFSGNAGQEFVEFLGVASLWPYVTGVAQEMGSIPSVDELRMRPQTWLRGLGDVPGELGKMVLDGLLEMDFSNKEERIAIRRRLVEVVQEIYGFLSLYETAYPQVINDSRMRGYRNTFRGMLQNVGFLLEKMKNELLGAMERN